jgi:LuxR family maltose regulon positive regulatory protein
MGDRGGLQWSCPGRSRTKAPNLDVLPEDALGGYDGHTHDSRGGMGRVSHSDHESGRVRLVAATGVVEPRGADIPAVVSAPPFDFVTSKVRVPAVRSDSVPRIGLVNRLRATRSSVLVVATAPAGYGKTTLLTQWAARDERPFAWVSIDSHDNDPVILLRHIAMAMAGAGPIDRAVLAALRSPGQAIWRVALPRLAAAIAGFPHPFALVLDEADLLESQESLDALSTLAEQIPDGSTLAIAGRAQPRLGLARLRAAARLFEIGPEQLALSRREAQLVLRAAGLELADDDVAELVARTEGWPAGVFLAALTLRGREAGEDRPLRITGEDRYVAEYLRSEHLEQIEPEMREFLVRSSVLGRMCGSLCDAVLETEASGARLEAMRESSLFLVPLDDRCEWYRYHHLFEDLLRHELSQSDTEAIPALNRRAADWYEAHGEPAAALEPAAESGDIDRAARIFAAVALPTYHSGNLTAIEGWLDRFPDDDRLARYPAVGVLGSWIHALRGRPDASERWLRASERGADAGPLPDGSTSARPWIAVLRAALCRDGVEQMRADAEDALIDLPVDSPLRPAALAMHGAAHVLLGDDEQGDLILALAADEATRLGAADTRLLALSERSLLASGRGDHAGADAFAFEARSLVADDGLGDYPTAAVELAACARGRLRQGRWDEARADLGRAHDLSRSLVDALPWFAVQAQLELARAHVTLRDADAAGALLAEIDDMLADRPPFGVLGREVDEVRRQVQGMRTADGHASGLTSAELRVLPLLQTHLSFREIGERQFVSRNTIKTQAISIYRKLGVSSRSGAIERAAELGLIDTEARIAPTEFIRSG